MSHSTSEIFTRDNRRVYLCTGEKSQSINICDATNRKGSYDWIIRLFSDGQGFPITQEDLLQHSESVNVLREWLDTRDTAQVEKFPPVEEELPAPPQSECVGDREWVERAIQAVESSITQLLDDFVSKPFLHRVEHSIHAELFRLLSSHLCFRETCNLFDGHQTQTLHKEWPETIARPGHRRGNFDIAIVTPHQLRDCTSVDFRRGFLRAPIVIELGLDYDSSHLASDRDKLLNSEVEYGYLVHLSRLALCPRTESIINNEDHGNGTLKTAYALSSNVRRRKHVDEPVVREVD